LQSPFEFAVDQCDLKTSNLLMLIPCCYHSQEKGTGNTDPVIIQVFTFCIHKKTQWTML